MRKLTHWSVATMLTITGVSVLGHDACMKTKAVTARRLIESTWQNHLIYGQGHHPWQWAEFSPIGVIEVPSLKITQPVLSDASGQSMAFGIGHVPGTALPGTAGNIVLSGNSGSFAGLLAQIDQGDTIILHDSDGSTTYQIIGSMVVKADNSAVMTQEGPDRLTLVTSYPIGGMSPTDERYVLTGFSVHQPSNEPKVRMMSF